MKIEKYILTAIKPNKKEDYLILIFETIYHTIMPMVLVFYALETRVWLLLFLTIPIIFIRLKIR